MSGQQEETQVDHREEALRAIVAADQERCDQDCESDRVRQLQAEAAVHSQLAVADELKEQNHWLEEIANQLSRAQS